MLVMASLRGQIKKHFASSAEGTSKFSCLPEMTIAPPGTKQMAGCLERRAAILPIRKRRNMMALYRGGVDVCSFADLAGRGRIAAANRHRSRRRHRRRLVQHRRDADVDSR